MFESAEIGHKLSKVEYEAQEPSLRIQLLEVQEDLKKASFPVIILIGGVDGAGKGETVNLLHEWIDPHYLETTPLEPHPMKSASVQKLGDFGEFSRLKDELVFYLDRGIRDLSSIASMARQRLEILTWR
jgi:hypothetical protein